MHLTILHTRKLKLLLANNAMLLLVWAMPTIIAAAKAPFFQKVSGKHHQAVFQIVIAATYKRHRLVYDLLTARPHCG